MFFGGIGRAAWPLGMSVSKHGEAPIPAENRAWLTSFESRHAQRAGRGRRGASGRGQHYRAHAERDDDAHLWQNWRVRLGARANFLGFLRQRACSRHHRLPPSDAHLVDRRFVAVWKLMSETGEEFVGLTKANSAKLGALAAYIFYATHCAAGRHV